MKSLLNLALCNFHAQVPLGTVVEQDAEDEEPHPAVPIPLERAGFSKEYVSHM